MTVRMAARRRPMPSRKPRNTARGLQDPPTDDITSEDKPPLCCEGGGVFLGATTSRPRPSTPARIKRSQIASQLTLSSDFMLTVSQWPSGRSSKVQPWPPLRWTLTPRGDVQLVCTCSAAALLHYFKGLDLNLNFSFRQKGSFLESF